MDIGFNIEVLQNFLHYNKVEEKYIKTAVSIFQECDKFNVNGKQGADGLLSGSEISAFVSACAHKLSDIGNIINNFVHPQRLVETMTEEEIAEDREILEDKIINTYTEARDKLVKQLASGDFVYPDSKIGENISAKSLIEYLQNMTFATSNYGGARAMNKERIEVNTTPSVGENIPLSWVYNVSQEEAMKILLHEALHCTYKSDFDTQEEEIFVESNAIKLMAQIIKNSNGEIKDFQITQYGESILELTQDDSHLESVLQERFINHGYKHRIKNESGDVNIEGYEIKGDDTVYINGRETGRIGSDFFIDELSPQMINLYGKPGGSIYMSEQEGSIPIEIRNEKGESVFTAYLVPAGDYQPIIFENKNGDSIALMQGDAIIINGKSYRIGENGVELQALNGFRGQLAIIREGEEPELISSNLVFNSVPPDEENNDEYAERPYKDFVVTDRNGLKYVGRMY